ncbi:MAG: glycosyltransferase family 39 protein, partial [Anaerolineaceae bacterium]|nr:glycosyltransferase family 39 protein [Anaerolineaceae bacterium]
WRSILALTFAVIAQFALEPPVRNKNVAIFFYTFSFGFLIWAILRERWVEKIQSKNGTDPMQQDILLTPLILSLVFGAIAFLAFGKYKFDLINTFFWLLSIIFFVWSLWTRKEKLVIKWQKTVSIFKKSVLIIKIPRWSWLLLAAFLLSAFFRFSQLDMIPGEMFSDHAEKLLDVSDVLKGNYWVFFPRNTGREAIQIYLTAAVSIIFGTGLSFMSLKIGTTIAGFCALPYIYLLGKEIGNRWIGLLAVILAGIAYWPNVISRVGLRFPLYPLFVAPTLFYFIRGLRNSNRNDFLLAGIALGLSLHGYSPARFLPFVLVFGLILYLIHRQSNGKRYQVILAFLFLTLITVLVFIPLLRYWFKDPAMFGYRALTRMGTVERAYPGPVVLIFLENLWNAMTMFFWNNGNIWVHSLPGRPALDVISAALFFIGIIYLVIRYLKNRDWLDLFLLISIPLLMMPSILSLAFPDENPSLNRTGGAIIPVFLVAAIALERILSRISAMVKSRKGTILAAILGIVLILFSVNQNYDLVFNQYKTQFLAGAWNTSEIGQVIRAFADSIGSSETAYVVPYPHWVDTRLVGINAGYPERDYALWPESFSETISVTGAKLFIGKPEDYQSLDMLTVLYEEGIISLHPSPLLGKDFWMFFVPPLD